MKALNIRGSLIPGWLKLLFKEQDIFRKSCVRNCHVLIPLHIITSRYLLHEARVVALQSTGPSQDGKSDLSLLHKEQSFAGDWKRTLVSDLLSTTWKLESTAALLDAEQYSSIHQPSKAKSTASEQDAFNPPGCPGLFFVLHTQVDVEGPWPICLILPFISDLVEVGTFYTDLLHTVIQGYPHHQQHNPPCSQLR